MCSNQLSYVALPFCFALYVSVRRVLCESTRVQSTPFRKKTDISVLIAQKSTELVKSAAKYLQKGAFRPS
ncbi:hypothetical protein CWE08_06440 [Aliidiomarina iranensis]|uniref:Uncharacterized protein n=1 Tax=Aliidiomarina iranensis TaxID=1434071 RepID=A0A432VXC2_9GAMM|nr:hypothetical protein CWE08_06440 [Aliidiomarina iranensis]